MKPLQKPAVRAPEGLLTTYLPQHEARPRGFKHHLPRRRIGVVTWAFTLHIHPLAVGRNGNCPASSAVEPQELKPQSHVGQVATFVATAVTGSLASIR